MVRVVIFSVYWKIFGLSENLSFDIKSVVRFRSEINAFLDVCKCIEFGA